MMKWLLRFLLRALKWLSIFSFILLANACDPFGTMAEFDLRAERTLLSLESPFFGGLEGSGAANQVVIVLVKEGGLQSREGRASLVELASVIESFKPAGILVALSFASSVRGEEARKSEIDQLGEIAARTPLVVLDQVGQSEENALTFAARPDGFQQTTVYPLSDYRFSSGEFAYGPADRQLSAAPRLFRKWCQMHDARCGDEPIGRGGLMVLGYGQRAPVGLESRRRFAEPWPGDLLPSYRTKAKLGTTPLDFRCQHGEAGTLGARLGRVVQRPPALMFDDGERADDPSEGYCQHFSTISARDVLASAHRELVADSLRDRFVVVAPAADFLGAREPDIGQVPAALLHARALENLLTYGSSYRRHAPLAILRSDLMDFVEIVLIFFVANLLGRARWLDLGIVLTIGVVGAAYFVCRQVWLWEPMNVFEVLGVGGLLALVVSPPVERIIKAAK